MGDDKEEQQAITNNPLLDGTDGAKDQAPGQVMDMPKTGRGKKVAIFLLVIILIIGAAGGVYYWQQQQAKKQAAELQSQITDLKKQVADAEKKAKETTASIDETKDWKTFNNTYWSYSIKYPTNYAIFISGNCPNADKTKDDNKSVSVAKTEDRLPICNADKFGQMTFYAQSGQPTADKDFSVGSKYFSDLTKAEVTLNGIKGYRYVYTNTGNGMQPKGSKGVTLEFGKNGTVYKAHYYEDSTSYPADLETFEKIVNKTWKF